MAMPDIVSKAAKLLKANAPELLTAIGISGVATTAYLAAKGGIRSAQVLEADFQENGYEPDRKKRIIREAKLVWKNYIPAGVSGAVTMGCILGSSKAHGNRTAAAVAAYSISEKAFSEYKDKVVEHIGSGKEQKVRDEVAQDRVNALPPGGREIVVVGGGNVLCCDLRTMRYFRSDMETLRRVQNDINFQILHENYIPMSEFYVAIGLPITDESNNVGWTFERQMELDFSTVLADNNEPCLAFRFNYTKWLREDPDPNDPPCEL